MDYVKVFANKSRDKVTFGSDVAKAFISAGQTVGFVMPKDMYILDLDSTSPRAKYIADYIIQRYPQMIVFKTPKAGGYHFIFKSESGIKAGTGFVTIFGCTVDIKRGNTHGILPDNFAGREYYNGVMSFDEFNKVIDDYNLWLSAQELRDLIPYTRDTMLPLDLTNLTTGTRNDTVFHWLMRWKKFKNVEDLNKYTRVISQLTNFSEKEITNSAKSCERYAIEDEQTEQTPILEAEIDRVITGKTLDELAVKTMDFLQKTKLIQFDICTGCYKTTLTLAHKDVMSQRDMWELFRVYFKDRIRYASKDRESGELRLKPISDLDLKSIFAFISNHCTYNSRAKMYEDIPAWDGKERIKEFLKMFYDCDANPNFFMLFMTAVVGKMKEPDKCYVPFFFDFCGEKGVGKSLMFKRILGNDLCIEIQLASREEDLCSAIYGKGAIIAVDDECHISEKWSDDRFKNFVTLDEDVFSRKFQDIERHKRAFVMCRTSNHVKSATDTDERRQIIFESKLPANTCRIWYDQVPETYFVQLRAEAKAYYEANGIYKLTREDWEEVHRQQGYYIDDENSFAQSMYVFINAIYDDVYAELYQYCYYIPEKNYPPEQAHIFVSWKHYAKWHNATHQPGLPMTGPAFWKNVRIASQKTKVLQGNMRRLLVPEWGMQLQCTEFDVQWYCTSRGKPVPNAFKPKQRIPINVNERIERWDS